MAKVEIFTNELLDSKKSEMTNYKRIDDKFKHFYQHM